jgi:hypothetical protein
MNSILRERVRMVIAKIEIALGYHMRKRDFHNEMDIPRAIRILSDFEDELASVDEETPLEMLQLPFELVTRLNRVGVHSIEALEKMSDEDLLEIDWVRAGRIAQIDEALARNGKKRV